MKRFSLEDLGGRARGHDGRTRLFPASALILSFVLITGCAAGRGAYNRGIEAELNRNYEEALAHYRDALTADPADIEYRLKVEQASFAAAFQRFENGRRAMEAGMYDLARTEFLRATELDPSHAMAASELQRVEALIASGAAQLPERRTDFEVRQEAARIDPSPERQISPTVTGPLSLVMTQDAQDVFETIGDLTGINIIFDPDVPPIQLNVNLENVSVFEALDILTLQSQTFWTPVAQNTVIIAPENPTKRRDYEAHVLKTIYLQNSVNPTDITEMITAVRTLLNLQYIAQSTSMNAITIRDTPDRVAIAEKIIDDFDKSKPEVVVEATVLEVDRNRLRELGILPPTQTTAGLDPDIFGEDNAVNIRDLGTLNSGSFNLVIPDSVATFLEGDSRTRLVQNPSVRASDGMVAQIRIGQRVPVASGSFQPAFVGATGTPVVQFQYVDVGVNMDITPRVLLNRDISMQVTVQVAATAGSSNIGGVALPIFSNRSITHEIRLSEGETNVLGGLISRQDITDTTGIPGLQDVPILKHFFSTESVRQDTSEIVILLTPHIVRMPDITDRNLNGLLVGTFTDTRLRGAINTTQPALLGAPGPPPLPIDLDRPQTSVGPSPSPAGPDAVRFEDETVSLEAGGTGEIKLHLSSGSLTGADLTIEFDPTRVALQQVVDGGFLSRDGNAITLVQSIDAGRGRAVVSVDRPDAAPALSGEGQVLSLTLVGLEPGTSTLRISEFNMRNGDRPARRADAIEALVMVQ